MKYHTNAKLTVHQRIAIREKFKRGLSITQMVESYHVNTKTVQKWIHRSDPTDNEELFGELRLAYAEALRQLVDEGYSNAERIVPLQTISIRIRQQRFMNALPRKRGGGLPKRSNGITLQSAGAG